MNINSHPNNEDSWCLVAGSRSWNRSIFDETIAHWSGNWRFVASPAELEEAVQSLAPRYAFFLHWSHIVPSHILAATECVCFHMTDVPFGRGGSPLQNLIARGFRETKLTALRMTEELDAGPIYAQERLCLEGGAEEIYIRATRVSVSLIERIWKEQPQPQPQRGEVEKFERRHPSQSTIPAGLSLSELHDFLRMLDAEGYPHAFLDFGGFRFEFSRPALYDGRVVADVSIRRAPAKDAEL